MSTQHQAVIFANNDYASVTRRLIAFVTDLAFVFALLTVVVSVTASVKVPPEVLKIKDPVVRKRQMSQYMDQTTNSIMTIAMFVVIAGYHVAGRRLPNGTIGYRVARIRIVDHAGRTPSWGKLFKRFLFAIPTCGMLALSYLSCKNSDKRQATHDVIAGTWLVLRRAEPSGPAKLAYNKRFFGTYAMTYVDVEAAPPEGDEPSLELPRATEAEPNAIR